MEIGQEPIDEAEAIARGDEQARLAASNGASLPSASQALSSSLSAVVPTATMLPPRAFTSFSAAAVSGAM